MRMRGLVKQESYRRGQRVRVRSRATYPDPWDPRLTMIDITAVE